MTVGPALSSRHREPDNASECSVINQDLLDRRLKGRSAPEGSAQSADRTQTAENDLAAWPAQFGLADARPKIAAAISPFVSGCARFSRPRGNLPYLRSASKRFAMSLDGVLDTSPFSQRRTSVISRFLANMARTKLLAQLFSLLKGQKMGHILSPISPDFPEYRLGSRHPVQPFLNLQAAGTSAAG